MKVQIVGINIIGVGPGDSELITVKAVRLLKEADIIITPVKKADSTESTALKIVKPYIYNLDKVVYFHFPMFHDFASDNRVQKLFKSYGDSINNYIDQGLNVVFITLGDAAVYSTFSYVAPYIKEIEYTPGIPSFINGAALAKIPLCLGDESFCVINMTDSEEHIRAAFNLHKNIVIMKVCSNQNLLKELIIEHDKKFVFMSNIGYETENLTRDLDVLNTKMPYFTVGIIN